MTLLVDSVVKTLPATQETKEMRVRSLAQEDALEKEMATHSSILARKTHGQRSLAGYSPKGPKELNTTEGLSTHIHTHTTFQTPKRQESPCSGDPRGSMALSIRIGGF